MRVFNETAQVRLSDTLCDKRNISSQPKDEILIQKQIAISALIYRLGTPFWTSVQGR
jgi:hypothetical protein